jgi:phage-related protein
MLPFGDQIERIKEKFAGLTKSQQIQAAASIVGIDHQNKFLELLKGSPGSFKAVSDGLDSVKGSTEKAFGGIDNTLDQKLKKMESAFGNLQQNIGKGMEPAILSIVEGITGLLDAFNNLSPGTQKVIIVIASVIGGLILLGSAIAILTPIFAALGALFGVISGVVSFLAGAVGMAVAPFLLLAAGIIAAGILIYVFWDEIVAAAKAAWKGIKSAFSAVVDWFSSIWTSVKDTVSSIWNGIKSTATTVFKAVLRVIVTPIKNAVATVIRAFLGLLLKAYTIFHKVKATISDVYNGIKNKLVGLAKAAFEWGSNMLKMFIDGIKSKVKAVVGAVTGVGKKIMSVFGFNSPPDKGVLSHSDKWMPNMMNMFTQGIEMGIPKLRMAVGDVASTIDFLGAGTTSTTNNINVYPQRSNLDAKGLNRELTRMSWLQGGIGF